MMLFDKLKSLYLAMRVLDPVVEKALLPTQPPDRAL